MALFRYLRPVGKALDPQGPLSEVVPSAVIREVNLEVQRKRGQYLSFTTEERARVAKYAYFGGVRPAVKRFSKEFGKDLRENTVRDWVKAYRKELGRKRTLTEIGDDLAVTELLAKKRGIGLYFWERRLMLKLRPSSQPCATMEQWSIQLLPLQQLQE